MRLKSGTWPTRGQGFGLEALSHLPPALGSSPPPACDGRFFGPPPSEHGPFSRPLRLEDGGCPATPLVFRERWLFQLTRPEVGQARGVVRINLGYY